MMSWFERTTFPGTYMYSDGYPSKIPLKWETISLVDPREVPTVNLGHSHSEVPPFGEKNGRPHFPSFLSVATAVR